MQSVEPAYFKAWFQSEKFASMPYRIESVKSTRSQKAARSLLLD